MRCFHAFIHRRVCNHYKHYFAHIPTLSNPSTSELIALVKQCSKTGDVEYGKRIHEHIFNHCLDSNLVIANTLIDMYAKCKDIALARETFDKMVHRNTVTWTCLIVGYTANGESSEAFNLFTSMDCERNRFSYAAALKACAQMASENPERKECVLKKGMTIHKDVKRLSFHSDIVIMNSLIEMYSKCGDMTLARETFEEIRRKDVVSWTSLMLGYVQNGDSFSAMTLFTSMDCEPNYVTYIAALKACSLMAAEKPHLCKAEALEKGKMIHRRAKESRCDSNLLVANTLLDMYAKCGSMETARDVFESIKLRNVVSWNSLLCGYVKNKDGREALKLFTGMDCEPDHVTLTAVIKACGLLAGQPESEKKDTLNILTAFHQLVKGLQLETNLTLASSLVDSYSKLGEMRLAREVFERMSHKDVVAWNCLMLGYVENGEAAVTLELLASMSSKPDALTYVAALKACGSQTEVSRGKLVHGTVCRLGLEEDELIATGLVDFYGRCGCVSSAVEVFNSMHSPDVVSWSALLGGCKSLGDSSEMVSLAKKMVEAGLRLDEITFMCILTACSHRGMVLEGARYFESMEKHGVRPSTEHYSCMVDMLSRASRVEEAVSVLKSMPLRASEAAWMSLLSACRTGRTTVSEEINTYLEPVKPRAVEEKARGLGGMEQKKCLSVEKKKTR